MKQLSKQAVRKSLLAVSAATLAMLVGTAQAVVTPVTTWGYSTNATFSNAVFEGPGFNIANPYELSWGCDPSAVGCQGYSSPTPSSGSNNRSAITIGNVVTGTRDGGGPATGQVSTTFDGNPFNQPLLVPSEVGKGISFTHWNNVIASNSLLTGTITDTLVLNALTPVAGPFYNAPTLTFNFHFNETPNGPSTCANGLANGVGNNIAGCADLFGFQGLQGGAQAFTYAGWDYLVQIITFDDVTGAPTAGIPLLSAASCAALGFTGPCNGFETREDFRTTVPFGFFVTSVGEHVPEPGSLALFGLALAGLGVMRQRKSR